MPYVDTEPTRDEQTVEGYDLLNPDKAYANDSGTVAWVTPDGIGCYWFDSVEESVLEEGDWCKTCGEKITWNGPGQYDYMHVNDKENQ